MTLRKEATSLGNNSTIIKYCGGITNALPRENFPPSLSKLQPDSVSKTQSLSKSPFWVWRECAKNYKLLNKLAVAEKMTSAPSDSESNVSGFIHYSDKNFKYLYTSMIENMEKINQDLLHVEKNMKNIVSQAGPLESQLNTLLQTLPKADLNISMETE